jgi:prephenate dehydrogenase
LLVVVFGGLLCCVVGCWRVFWWRFLVGLWCVDVNSSNEEVSIRIAVSDVIFLCIPIDKTKDWILDKAQRLRGKTLIEQTSVKSWLKDKQIREACKNYKIKILSMHILFRPSSTPNKNDRHISLIWPPSESHWNACGAYRFISSEINWKCGCGFETIEEHDRVMARQQALVHRVLLVLSCQAHWYPGTYIGKRLTEISQRICSGDPVLYDIIQKNPYLESELKKFDANMKKFKIGDYMRSPGPEVNKTKVK